MTRSSVLSLMSQPYIEMAFLKGIPRSRVIMKHALPNAAAPIISVIALNLAGDGLRDLLDPRLKRIGALRAAD